MDPADFAMAVEERGFYSLYVPEHTHLPVRADSPPALVEGVGEDDYKRSLDPYVALASAASVTERILLGTGVTLVAQHDPIVLAKQIATLDHLSGGRFVLGVGFGWNEAEASDHGVDFVRRRDLAREKLLCMRALWAQERAEYHGELVSLEPSWSWPKPVQGAKVRTLIGAGAATSVFEAVAEYADGWMPVGGSGLASAVARLREQFVRVGRDPARLHVVPFGSLPDRGKLEHFESVGATEVVLRVPAGPADSMLRVLDDYTQFL